MKTVRKRLLSILLCAVLLILCETPVVDAAEAGEYEPPYADSLFFEIGDYTIHYRIKTASNPKGYILFIHGFALSGYCFEKLSDKMFDNGYTCVLVDLPGYGYSTRETSDTRFIAREEILTSLIQSIHLGKWIIAGHSMGGFVALSMLASHPEAVETLLLYGTSGEDGFSDTAKSVLSNKYVINMAGSFMESLAKSDLLVKILLSAAFGDVQYVRNYDIKRVTEPLRIKGTGVGAMYALLGVTPTDYDAVAAFGSPILFMNGSNDSVISYADRDKLASFLPEGSENISVEGGYHLFIENMADKVAELTLNFLNK